MSGYISKRVSSVQPSATVAISDRAKQMKRAGLDVIDLAGGDPDFDTPEAVIQAALEAMRDGYTHYVSSRGLPELLNAISEKLLRDNGLKVNPDTDVIVTPSGKHALFISILSVVGCADKVLILDPSWVSYDPIVRLADAVPIHISLEGTEFHVDMSMLKKAILPGTKLLIINSPNNPTGRVLTIEELETIAEFAMEHDLLVISDEVYEKITFDGRSHHSLGALAGMEGRVMTINGFSKTYAMTGWRLGYVAAQKHLIDAALKVQQHSVSCAAAFVQKAGVEALKNCANEVFQMVKRYGKRREMILEALDGTKGVRCYSPEGTFYLFMDIRDTGMSSKTAADKLLEEGLVALTPGSAFGKCGEGYLRLSFAASDEALVEGCKRISQVFNHL